MIEHEVTKKGADTTIKFLDTPFKIMVYNRGTLKMVYLYESNKVLLNLDIYKYDHVHEDVAGKTYQYHDPNPSAPVPNQIWMEFFLHCYGDM